MSDAMNSNREDQTIDDSSNKMVSSDGTLATLSLLLNYFEYCLRDRTGVKDPSLRRTAQLPIILRIDAEKAVTALQSIILFQPDLAKSASRQNTTLRRNIDSKITSEQSSENNVDKSINEIESSASKKITDDSVSSSDESEIGTFRSRRVHCLSSDEASEASVAAESTDEEYQASVVTPLKRYRSEKYGSSRHKQEATRGLENDSCISESDCTVCTSSEDESDTLSKSCRITRSNRSRNEQKTSIHSKIIPSRVTRNRSTIEKEQLMLALIKSMPACYVQIEDVIKLLKKVNQDGEDNRYRIENESHSSYIITDDEVFNLMLLDALELTNDWKDTCRRLSNFKT